MYSTPTQNTAYIGIATNKDTEVPSIDKADYSWSRFKGEDGSSNINLGFIFTSNIVLDSSQNKVTRLSGSGWDAQVYSSLSYLGGCSVQSSPTTKMSSFMFGLSDNPTSSISFDHIDYAILLRSNGSKAIYESGSAVGEFGTYEIGDKFNIEYDNQTIKYYQNGNLLRTLSTTENRTFHFGSSFGTSAQNITEYITFIPIGAKGSDGTNGTNGTNGAKGDKGDIGPTGPSGISGPSIVYRGLFANGTTYYNNTQRRDVVKYGSVFYIYKGTNGANNTSWSSSNWENFGVQFESVATNLLLAESANIADWIISNGKITSQNQSTGRANAVLNGVDGRITFNGRTYVLASSGSGGTTVDSFTVIDNEGLLIERASGSSQQASNVQIKPDQININAAAPLDASSYGSPRVAIYSSVNVNSNNIGTGINFVAAVLGKVNNTSSSPAPSYGGYFEGLYAEGVHVRSRSITSTTYLDDMDYYVDCVNSSDITVYLPSSPNNGRIVRICRGRDDVLVNGNGKTIKFRNDNLSTINVSYDGNTAELIYVQSGNYWRYSELSRKF
ncbi:virion structural protein [Cellulophaga phage phiST]|uniref:Uncharacterized protein n=1 Tax=Cellulophaga phage phiST TaxID=756282 RepID=M4T1V1_9CAUD|nr:virion structural protein [Cellulophaga phage phiST]AGH56784.1 hypothetical protein CGPG_00086 [Cellulophaga phage phiST]